MSTKTVTTCDVCHEEVKPNDPASLDVRIDGVVFDVCMSCGTKDKTLSTLVERARANRQLG